MINFCPGSYDNLNDDLLTRIGLHEVMHALVGMKCYIIYNGKIWQV